MAFLLHRSRLYARHDYRLLGRRFCGIIYVTVVQAVCAAICAVRLVQHIYKPLHVAVIRRRDTVFAISRSELCKFDMRDFSSTAKIRVFKPNLQHRRTSYSIFFQNNEKYLLTKFIRGCIMPSNRGKGVSDADIIGDALLVFSFQDTVRHAERIRGRTGLCRAARQLLPHPPTRRVRRITFSGGKKKWTRQ